MSIYKSLSVVALSALFFLQANTSVAGTILLGGIEDYAGGSAVEGHGDYNDLMFEMTGNISAIAAQAAFSALAPNMVDESGTIFWDQHSSDGADYNFGYCATGLGNCVVAGLPGGPLNYLAGPGGAAPMSELFQASGPITVNLLFEKTSNLDKNTLGWYDPTNPGVLHQIFAGPDGAGTSVTFTPSGVFALYSTNGLGPLYSSLASDNQQESATRQHFAFLEIQPTETPEPGTGVLAGLVLTIVGLARLFRHQFQNL
jgi:hypothetical protein